MTVAVLALMVILASFVALFIVTIIFLLLRIPIMKLEEERKAKGIGNLLYNSIIISVFYFITWFSVVIFDKINAMSYYVVARNFLKDTMHEIGIYIIIIFVLVYLFNYLFYFLMKYVQNKNLWKNICLTLFVIFDIIILSSLGIYFLFGNIFMITTIFIGFIGSGIFLLPYLRLRESLK